MGSVTGAKPAKALSPVLCVDLDGTLIRGNVLWECVLVLLKTRPSALLLFPFWLLAGRASLKRHVAARTHLDPARLPYRQQVLELIQQEKASGRRIALVTAADRELAEAIASYLGLFDEVHASDGKLNLKGANKSAFLAQHFAQTGFEYVGEWRSANGAVLEFEKEIDGIRINGVDIITFNDDGSLITHFKVMIRPLKAINLLHRLMGEQLAKQ